MELCKKNTIFIGEIASVQAYGAFVRIPGCKQQGLIHKTQVNLNFILKTGEDTTIFSILINS